MSGIIQSMSKETYQEIKRISGEELRDLLSDLDKVYDLGTGIFFPKVI
tara:strand:- start:395 stop:538 length:144 start_codon:yes stop_codon:yes gene_type:complete